MGSPDWWAVVLAFVLPVWYFFQTLLLDYLDRRDRAIVRRAQRAHEARSKPLRDMEEVARWKSEAFRMGFTPDTWCTCDLNAAMERYSSEPFPEPFEVFSPECEFHGHRVRKTEDAD